MTGLVVSTNPSEKYEFVNWDDEIPNVWENKSHVPGKPPTSWLLDPYWDNIMGYLLYIYYIHMFG